MKIRINNFCHSSVNGPGYRLVIWTQGCVFNCKGCFNPETHPKQRGVIMDVDALLEIINNDNAIEGITISGGEPLLHPGVLCYMLKGIRKDLTKIVYTGFSVEEISKSRWKKSVLKYSDLTIAGRYNRNLKHPYLGKKFLCSTNKIDMSYFLPKRTVEYSIGINSVTKTGIF